MLANPAQQYPSTFGKIQFFHDFPYALPTLVVGALNIVALVVIVLFVDEVCGLWPFCYLCTNRDRRSIDDPAPQVIMATAHYRRGTSSKPQVCQSFFSSPVSRTCWALHLRQVRLNGLTSSPIS